MFWGFSPLQTLNHSCQFAYDYMQIFPCSSVGKESAYNAGDLGSIPGLETSTGEGIGNPLRYSCLENCVDYSLSGSTVHGVTRVGHDLVTKPPPYCLPQWLHQFTFPPEMEEGSLFSTPSPAFIVCRIFDDGHSDWCMVVSHCSFDLHFSDNE